MKTTFTASATMKNNTKLKNIVLNAKPVLNSNNFTFKNCDFVDIDLPNDQSNHLASAIIGPSGWGKTKVVIDGCNFEDNNKAYNAMELAIELANGSEISNNNFGIVGTHNVINIYDVENGAYININDNVFEKAANGIRIGIKGDKACTINIKRNTYKSTDEGEYAGLVLIQPYATATISMKNVRINIDDTVNESGEDQLWYYYAGASDTQLAVEDRPKVYVNGKLQKYTDED